VLIKAYHPCHVTISDSKINSVFCIFHTATTYRQSRDVQNESILLPINENYLERKVNTADHARLDISTRGLWNSCGKTFFDINITHHTSQSYSGKSVTEIYQKHQKKNTVNLG